MTTNHIIGLEVVLPDGEIVSLGGKVLDQPGCDLTGLFVGSEGTLGIVTKIIVRIVRLPEVVRTQLALFSLGRRCGQRRVGDYDGGHPAGRPGIARPRLHGGGG